MSFNHVLKHQKFITSILFILFSAVIIVQIIYPQRNLETPLSILTGWLGIVIGFFFNQEFSEHLKHRLDQEIKDKQKIEAKVNEKLSTMLSVNEKIKEEYDLIIKSLPKNLKT